MHGHTGAKGINNLERVENTKIQLFEKKAMSFNYV
jgi:hypothetical protein